ncbi:MAG: helix-turn-helix domain-containing protein [Oscillospiraceae bacterium]|nr:helix-turn-helix domain-containing protein [Oscillospiraceae bacterium]
MNKIPERLRLLRKGKKLYQKDMVNLLNITERQYNSYEAGKVDLGVSKLIFLADYFDVSLDYLVGRSDNSGRL